MVGNILDEVFESTPYTILYKTSKKGNEFKIINLLPTRPGILPKFEKIMLALNEDIMILSLLHTTNIRLLSSLIPLLHNCI